MTRPERAQNNWQVSNAAFFNRVAALGSDISPAKDENYRAFVRAYAPLIARLKTQPHWAVLDLGCGSGYLARIFSAHAASYTGVDISEKSLELARHRNPGSKFIHSDFEHAPLKPNSLDCVTAITSLEYAPDKKTLLTSIHKALKSGGLFYFEVRNPKFALSWLSQKNIAVQMREVSCFEDISIDRWEALLMDAGFCVIKKYPALRPWNYGSIPTRLKQFFIGLVRLLTPVKRQYMVGFLCEKK